MLCCIYRKHAFSVDGWSYLVKLHHFVDGGMQDITFVDDASRIITRGYLDLSCGTLVSSTAEQGNSLKAQYMFCII